MPRLVALAALVLVLAAHTALGFRDGWSRINSDFPNYYTAARLALEHKPLQNFYEWEWFQREADLAGVEHQLTTYTPHTPFTLVPFLPLAQLPPLTAKRVWLVLNLVMLGMLAWLVRRFASTSWLVTVTLVLVCDFALRTNFAFGQYYILLTLLIGIACSVAAVPAGAILGLVFAFKLYTGPFLLYFAARREWRALASMIAVIAGMIAAGIWWFGYQPLHFYATSILARALDGEINDPYSTAWASLSPILRRTFIAEPELNPSPLFQAPELFFFFKTFITMGTLTLVLTAAWREGQEQSRLLLAWFLTALVAINPNLVSYHFVLLLIPVALLYPFVSKPTLIALFALAELPWTGLRPVWLFALFLFAGWRFLTGRRVAFALAVAAIAGTGDALLRDHQTLDAEYAVARPGEYFEARPVAWNGQVVYESIRGNQYTIESTAGTVYRGPSNAFFPRADGDTVTFDVASGEIQVVDECRKGVASPDGTKLAYACNESGGRHIFIEDRATGARRKITQGRCLNSAPAWESNAILFQSDCNRGVGITAIRRIKVDSFSRR